MSKGIIFVAGLLSGIAICGLFSWGIDASFQAVSMQAYNGMNERVNKLEQRLSYMTYELQTEKGNREYSLNRMYTTIYELDDKIDSWSDKYITQKDLYDAIYRHEDEGESQENAGSPVTMMYEILQ